MRSNARKDKQRNVEGPAAKTETAAMVGNHRAIYQMIKTLCGDFKAGHGPIKSKN